MNMNTAEQKIACDLDWWLAGCAAVLLYIGLVIITSASIDIADARTVGVDSSGSGNPFYYAMKHGVFLCLALTVACVVIRVPTDWWCRNGWLLLFVSLALLVLVLVIGREVNGSIRWIGLGQVNFQPSEVAKLFLIAYLAGYLVRRNDEVTSSWWGFIKPMVVMFVAALLLLMEPDFGATVVILVAAFGMIFLSGAKLVRFGTLLMVATVLGVALIFFQPYRFQRVISFANPWADQFGSGYQLTQALIAFGRGEWFGVGLGNSVQKLMYLPEAHTDFVFAILAEEFGLLGSIFVISLFVVLVYRSMRIGRLCEAAGRYFSAYFAYGLSILIGFQAFINIGVNCGLLPTKGLTLPLVSYGGSSLIVSCALVSILLRIDLERKWAAGVTRPGLGRAR
ncbi:MAG: putative lipid II flippase FtsW [Proteobacteria bacterium]|nr:MAG: putative lipid II flippase FtsW [Pseudomonadota bacterium]